MNEANRFDDWGGEMDKYETYDDQKHWHWSENVRPIL